MAALGAHLHRRAHLADRHRAARARSLRSLKNRAMVHGVRIKDHWSEQRIFDQRVMAAGVIIVVASLLLFGRLFILQILRHDYYAELSQGNRVRIEPILDRNGEVIADNQPAFQLELVPEEVPDLKKTLNGLGALGLIPREDLDEVTRSIRSRRAFDSVPIRLR